MAEETPLKAVKAEEPMIIHAAEESRRRKSRLQPV